MLTLSPTSFACSRSSGPTRTRTTTSSWRFDIKDKTEDKLKEKFNTIYQEMHRMDSEVKEIIE